MKLTIFAFLLAFTAFVLATPLHQDQLIIQANNVFDTVEQVMVSTISQDRYRLYGFNYFIPGVKNPRPVLIFPGLMDSAYSLNLIQLSVQLATRGHSVYLVNPRGSIWGRSEYDSKHESFSWDDMARYDINAWLKYIPEQGNITFIGHSQGATSMLAALSEGWLTGRVLGNIHLLAPVTYLKHQNSPVMSVLSKIGVDGVVDHIPTRVMQYVNSQLLQLLKSHTLKYSNSLKFMFGPSQEISDQGDQKWAFEWPQRTSSRNLAHWLNDFRQGVVSKYPTNEKYDFTRIPQNVRIFLYFGYNDYLTDSRDVNLLLNDLEQSGVEVVSTTWINNYAHMDIVWANSAHKKLFPLILNNV